MRLEKRAGKCIQSTQGVGNRRRTFLSAKWARINFELYIPWCASVLLTLCTCNKCCACTYYICTERVAHACQQYTKLLSLQRTRMIQFEDEYNASNYSAAAFAKRMKKLTDPSRAWDGIAARRRPRVVANDVHSLAIVKHCADSFEDIQAFTWRWRSGFPHRNYWDHYKSLCYLLSYLPRTSRWITEVLSGINDHQFRFFIRRPRRDFSFALHRLQSGPGAKLFTNNSFNEQFSVSLKLAAALLRLGLSGIGASALTIFKRTGISWGAVANSYTRVVRVLILMAENEIKWPHGQERERLKRREGDYGFPHALFAIDGTTIPLFERPTLDHEAFYDWKSNYSLNAFIARNCDRIIINAVVGFLGSLHDTIVVRSSCI